MASKGQITDMFKQLELAFKKIDALSKELKGTKNELSNVKDELKEKDIKINKLETENGELKLEIERLKNQINKDSNNSSKPSSTNGFKRAMNNREKSGKKKGGQIGHLGKTLSPKYIEKLIESGEVDEVKIVEIGKNIDNQHMHPIIKYTYDLEIKRVVTKTLYYPNKEISAPRGKPVSYGEHVKALACLLNANYMSYDGIVEIFNHLTNNTIHISKATTLSWNETLSKKLTPQTENIKTKLLNSFVLNVDESPVKIDGEQYYIHTASNGQYTLQYKTKHRSKDDIDAFKCALNNNPIIT